MVAAGPPGDPASAVVHEDEGRAPTSHPATRLSATWTGVVVALIVLVVLIVFIAENTQRTTISFFGLHGSAPVSVMLLAAAVAGALVVVSVAVARMVQLRLAARRNQTQRRGHRAPAVAVEGETADTGVTDAYDSQTPGITEVRQPGGASGDHARHTSRTSRF